MNPVPPDVPWRALAAFRYCIRVFFSRSERAVRGVGLEPQQHQLLLAVRAAREKADPTIGDLAADLLLKHHSVVGLVNRLQQKGLVSRHHRPEDRRRVCVRLTPEGEALLSRLTGALLEEYRVIGPELVQALREVLGRPGSAGEAPRGRSPAAPARRSRRRPQRA